MNIVKTWEARIASGTFTKAECRVWAQTVAVLASHDTPRRRTALTTEQAEHLWDLLDAAPVRLTDDHTAQGLAWLRSAQGRRQLGLPADVTDAFDHFAFCGHADLDVHGRQFDVGGRYVLSAVPIYRIVTTDGQAHDYYVRSWQSGGGCEHWLVAPVLASLDDPADGGKLLATLG